MPSKITVDKILLIKYFCKENKTLHEIGELLNCSRKTVAREIKEYQSKSFRMYF